MAPPENAPNHWTQILFEENGLRQRSGHREHIFLGYPTWTPKSAQAASKKVKKVCVLQRFIDYDALGHSSVCRPSLSKLLKIRLFYNVLGALARPMSGPLNEHQKSENERRAAWERF